jgi:hypothetical protein
LPAIVSASADLNSEVKSEAVPYALIPGFANRSPNRCKRMIRIYIEALLIKRLLAVSHKPKFTFSIYDDSCDNYGFGGDIPQLTYP